MNRLLEPLLVLLPIVGVALSACGGGSGDADDGVPARTPVGDDGAVSDGSLAPVTGVGAITDADAPVSIDAVALNARLYRSAPGAMVLDVPVIGRDERDNAELRRAVPYEIGGRDTGTTLDAFWLVAATNRDGEDIAEAIGVLTNRGAELDCDTQVDFDSATTDTRTIDYRPSTDNPLFVPLQPYGYGVIKLGESVLARGIGCIAPGESIYAVRPLVFPLRDESGVFAGFENPFDVLRSVRFDRVTGSRDPALFGLDPTDGIVAVSATADTDADDRLLLTLANRANVPLTMNRTAVFVLDDQGLPVHFVEQFGGLAFEPGEERTVPLDFRNFAGSSTRILVVPTYEFREAGG